MQQLSADHDMCGRQWGACLGHGSPAPCETNTKARVHGGTGPVSPATWVQLQGAVEVLDGGPELLAIHEYLYQHTVMLQCDTTAATASFECSARLRSANCRWMCVVMLPCELCSTC